MKTPPAKNIDEYISLFPANVQKLLEEMRMTIQKAAPDAEETISYAIPAFHLNKKYLIYFAGYKNHIGMYPVPAGIEAFDKEYAPYYTSGKGTIRFPLDKPLPLELITKIVKFRLEKITVA